MPNTEKYIIQAKIQAYDQSLNYYARLFYLRMYVYILAMFLELVFIQMTHLVTILVINFENGFQIGFLKKCLLHFALPIKDIWENDNKNL